MSLGWQDFMGCNRSTQPRCPSRDRELHPERPELQDFLRKCPSFGSCEPYLQQMVTARIILTAVECNRLVLAEAWSRALPVVAGAFLEKYKSYQVTT